MVIVGAIFLFSHSKEDTITFGFVGPLSGFGASWGEEQKLAVQIAVDEINQTGGINGKKLKVIYEDGKCVEKDAVTAAQKLISIDKVKVLFSVCGAESLVIAPIAEQNKIIQMAIWSTHPKLSGVGQYIFRNSQSDNDTGKLMAQIINKNYTKVAIIHEESTYANGLRDIFKRYFTGQVIEEDYQSDTKDFRSYLVDALSKKPETFIINPTSPTGGILAIQQLRQLGFKGQIYGNYFGGVNEVINSKEAEGMIFFSDPYVADNLLKDNLYKKFENISEHKPNFDFAVSISYDSVYILKQAIEKEGMDNSKIKDYLHQLKDFKGVMGTYGFNEKGDAIGYTPSVYQIKNGQVVLYQK